MRNDEGEEVKACKAVRKAEVDCIWKGGEDGDIFSDDVRTPERRLSEGFFPSSLIGLASGSGSTQAIDMSQQSMCHLNIFGALTACACPYRFTVSRSFVQGSS